MKIRLCQHNQGSEQLLHRLQGQYPDLDSKLKKCTKQCKICKQQPFALFAKELVLASDVETLYARLGELIEAGKAHEK